MEQRCDGKMADNMVKRLHSRVFFMPFGEASLFSAGSRAGEMACELRTLAAVGDGTDLVLSPGVVARTLL